MNLRIVRIATWAVGAVAIVAIGLMFWFAAQPGQQNTAVSRADPSPDAVTVGGPFQLVDQTGAPVTDADLRGHPSLMFFGYTFCPDVCPTALAEATAWLKELGPEAKDLKVYFVTVDPERDTQQAMASYLTAFDPRIVGMTGPKADVEAMLKAYRVYYSRVEPTDGSDVYLMDHSASFYLLDANGRLMGLVDYNATSDEALQKIRRLIAETA